MKVNTQAVEFARRLIREGKVIRDEHSDWHEQAPTREDGNKFLENHSWDDYANWHLGINPGDNSDTKRYYEFPFGNGDFTKVVRSGLVAAEDRAGQYGHSDIEKAAKSLLSEIDKN